MDDFWRKEEKLQWLSYYRSQTIPFDFICPDKKNYWINIPDNDFQTLLPLSSPSRLSQSLFDWD
jgi:predicted helicase